MRSGAWFAVAAISLFSLPWAASAEDNVNRAAIDDANARLIALQKDGDAEGMARMYTEDAVLLPSGGPRAEGRDAIEAFWAKALAPGVEEVHLRTENLEALGDDLLYEIGSYTTTPKNAEPVTGYYVVLWKRVDGSWKLHVDIFNVAGGP